MINEMNWLDHGLVRIISKLVETDRDIRQIQMVEKLGDLENNKKPYLNIELGLDKNIISSEESMRSFLKLRGLPTFNLDYSPSSSDIGSIWSGLLGEENRIKINLYQPFR